METRSCPFCEAELPTGATVCRLCGHNVGETNPWRRFWARAKGWVAFIAVVAVILVIVALVLMR